MQAFWIGELVADLYNENWYEYMTNDLLHSRTRYLFPARNVEAPDQLILHTHLMLLSKALPTQASFTVSTKYFQR